MHDDDTKMLNMCLDLVGTKKLEAFPQTLLTSKRAGEWVSVKALCQQLGIDPSDLPSSLFAVWHADPLANDAYAVILFYDCDSHWTTAAHANRARFGSGPKASPLSHVPAAAVPSASPAARAP